MVWLRNDMTLEDVDFGFSGVEWMRKLEAIFFSHQSAETDPDLRNSDASVMRR